MPVSTRCPVCGHHFRIPAKKFSRTIRCPNGLIHRDVKAAGKFVIPGPTA
jgi:transposase